LFYGIYLLAIDTRYTSSTVAAPNLDGTISFYYIDDTIGASLIYEKNLGSINENGLKPRNGILNS
jgi:hypothetical protein